MAYTGNLLSRKKCIKVKIETTKGTQETDSLTDVFVDNPVMRPTGPFIKRVGSGKYLGNNVPGLIGLKSGLFSCRTEIRGNGSTGLDAGLAILLQGAGFLKSSETYTFPTSSIASQKTITIELYEDGLKKVLAGAMGTVNFDGDVGGTLFGNFEFSGRWIAPTDVALPSYSPGTEIPPVIEAGTFTVASESLRISRLGIDTGNVVTPSHDVNSSGGIAFYKITDNDPVLTMDPEADLVANYDFNGIWLAGTEGAVAFSIGEGTDDKIAFAIPKLQYKEMNPGDREGLVIYDINGQCNNSSGDDAITISVTDDLA